MKHNWDDLKGLSREELLEAIQNHLDSDNPKEAERIVDYMVDAGMGLKIEFTGDHEPTEEEIKKLIESQMGNIVKKMAANLHNAISMSPHLRLVYKTHSHKGSECSGSRCVADAKDSNGDRPDFDPGHTPESPIIGVDFPACPECRQLIDVEWAVGPRDSDVGYKHSVEQLQSSQENNFHEIMRIFGDAALGTETDEDRDRALVLIECLGKFRMAEYDPPGMLELGLERFGEKCSQFVDDGVAKDTRKYGHPM